MSKLKKLYREFFGLTEGNRNIPGLDPADAANLANYNKELEKTQSLMKGMGVTEKLDPIGYEDDDIDNDLKKNTKSDQYLKNRRDIRKRAIKKSDLDEAQLINNLTDYRGGIEYVLRDPATAQQTAKEIQEWAERKGFAIIKKTISPSGKIGYFYFRLGQDPALESQKLQGYLAQKPELKHFRFNVKTQESDTPRRKI